MSGASPRAKDPALTPLGVELRGVYDGVAIWLHPDGRIENRFGGDEWHGSTRWKAIEQYIAANAEALSAVIRRQWPLPDGAEGQDQHGNAEDG